MQYKIVKDSIKELQWQQLFISISYFGMNDFSIIAQGVGCLLGSLLDETCGIRCKQVIYCSPVNTLINNVQRQASVCPKPITQAKTEELSVSATLTGNSAMECNTNALGNGSFSNSAEEISRAATVRLSLRVINKPKETHK